MPTRRPAARPDTSRGALSFVMKTAGRNSLESNESARDTVITKNGAVRSATAYQRPPTRQLSNRASTSRSPAQPETRLVIRRPARLGPASIATYMAGPIVKRCSMVVGIPPGPTTNRTPAHETANARAK